MATLNDLLVSYKQVENPKKPEIESIELPSTRYHRMLNYINTKTEDAKDESSDDTTTENPIIDGFIGWTYNKPSSAKTSTKAPSSWSNPYNSRKNQWLSDITAAYKRLGLNDNAIKNLIAKNALESGWGKSAQGDYNFGNITTGKSWTGRFVLGQDHDADGNKISQKFRAYDTLDDYVKDEILFLTNLYDFNQDDNFDTFISKLQGNNSGKRKYAEDKNYALKVRSVYNNI